MKELNALGRSNDRVSVPDGELDGVKVSTFTIGPHDLGTLRAMLGAGRGTRPGSYAKLMIDGNLRMSDTDAEYSDHGEAIRRIQMPTNRHVLINGLGLGMVVKAALDQPHVEHVDVVEIDPRVVALVGPHYADPRLTIHTADAFTIKWPAKTHWAVAWHDIWQNFDWEKNLPEQDKLRARYFRKAGWQGSWGRKTLLARRRADKGMRW